MPSQQECLRLGRKRSVPWEVGNCRRSRALRDAQTAYGLLLDHRNMRTLSEVSRSGIQLIVFAEIDTDRPVTGQRKAHRIHWQEIES